MAWPKKVRDEVLVNCGRHCCICHKFCGIKIELHHIKFKSEEGEETLENCIPLCFDCHSDQKSYDFKHPKGTKYSREELIKHREKWYAMATQNLGTGTTDHLEQDKSFFQSVYNKIPPKPTIRYLQQIDFRENKFRLSQLSAITNLISEINLEPWLEFFDSDIQAKFSELLKIMTDFDKMIETETYDFEDGIFDHQCVPMEWKTDDPNRYSKVTDRLNLLARNIVKVYAEFIRLSRKKLGVILTH